MTTNGTSSSEATPVVSTLPGPDHNWQVTLAGKVIASASQYHSHFSRAVLRSV
ncbi:hypothetical protein BDW67DRAFT_154932 [Aspergillus spinulosporus]